MASQGESEAINRLGPALSSSGLRNAAQKTAFTAAPSAFIPIPNLSGFGRNWITMLPTGGDVHIAFVPALATATVADRIFLVGQEYDYEIPAGALGFVMIADTATPGNLYWHLSS